jgi:hypothetical protein
VFSEIVIDGNAPDDLRENTAADLANRPESGADMLPGEKNDE